MRLVGCYNGEFQLQLARANNNTDEGRVVRHRPVIKFKADSNKCDEQTYDAQTIELKQPLEVKKGDQLVIRTPKTTILRCDFGGHKILLFAPPLVAGESPRPALDGDGCWLLFEAEYNDGRRLRSAEGIGVTRAGPLFDSDGDGTPAAERQIHSTTGILAS